MGLRCLCVPLSSAPPTYSRAGRCRAFCSGGEGRDGPLPRLRCKLPPLHVTTKPPPPPQHTFAINALNTLALALALALAHTPGTLSPLQINVPLVFPVCVGCAASRGRARILVHYHRRFVCLRVCLFVSCCRYGLQAMGRQSIADFLLSVKTYSVRAPRAVAPSPRPARRRPR